MNDDEERSRSDQAHRLEVLERIVRELLPEVGIDAVRRDPREEHRVAVARCARSRFSADRAAGSRPIVDNHLLPERRRELLRHQPGDGVVPAARGKRHDEAHRLRRPRLRKQRRGEARGEQRAENELLHRTPDIPPSRLMLLPVT
jgi:hypothetical protein